MSLGAMKEGWKDKGGIVAIPVTSIVTPFFVILQSL